MKRYSLIGLLSLLVAVTVWAAIIEVPEAPARMTAVVVGGGGGGGAAAASGYYDPDEDVDDGDWTSQENFSKLDDGIRSPTGLTTDDADRTGIGFAGRNPLILGMEDVTGSITSIKIWIHGWDRGNAAGIHQVQACRNGTSDCTSQVNIDTGDDYYGAWGSVTISSLSWDGAPALRLKIYRTGEGNSDSIYVNAAYIEVNPS